MNINELRRTQKFLRAARQLDPDLTVQRLMVLLEIAIQGEITQGALVKAVGQNRSACSKNVASWTALTSRKTRGPGFVRSDLDPMNMSTRVLSITEKGSHALGQLTEGL